jgi:hypothetical protein
MSTAPASPPGDFEQNAQTNHQESSYWYWDSPEEDKIDFEKNNIDNWAPETDEGESVEPYLPPIADKIDYASELDTIYFMRPGTDEGESVEPHLVDGRLQDPPIARSNSRNFRLDELQIPEIQRNAVLAHRERTALWRERHTEQREEVRNKIRQLDEENALLRRDNEHLNRYLESVQVRNHTQDASDTICCTYCRSNLRMHLTSSATPQSAINQFHIASPAQAAALPAAQAAARLSPCPPANYFCSHTCPPHV